MQLQFFFYFFLFLQFYFFTYRTFPYNNYTIYKCYAVNTIHYLQIQYKTVLFITYNTLSYMCSSQIYKVYLTFSLHKIPHAIYEAKY